MRAAAWRRRGAAPRRRCAGKRSPSLAADAAPPQEGFVDWSEVRADDLELPEDDDLGIHTCAAAAPACLAVLLALAGGRPPGAPLTRLRSARRAAPLLRRALPPRTQRRRV